MSLTSTTTRVQYSGNSSTTVFPITFAFWDADDLLVINTVTATGVETEWTRGNQFTVTGGAGSTGSLTATTAPVTGTTLSIISDLPNTQPTSLPVGGQFPSATVEQQLDQIVRQVQQTNKLIDRALVQPDGDAADIARLPAKAARASQYLGFDANGDPVGLAPPANTTAVSAFMATVLDDADAATARTTLGAATPSADNLFTADQTITSTDAGATAGPTLTLKRNSASPAVSDIIGQVDFQSKDSGGGTDSGVRIRGVIVDPTAASGDAELHIQTEVAGAVADRVVIGQGAQVGSPTGGDKGAGSLNAQTLWLNGTQITGVPVFTKEYISSEVAVSATLATFTHGLGVPPRSWKLVMRCKTAEGGYSVGDEYELAGAASIDAAGIMRGVSVIADGNGTTLTALSSSNGYQIVNKSTDAGFTITTGNWKWVMRAWA